jgi:hypothetical protein
VEGMNGCAVEVHDLRAVGQSIGSKTHKAHRHGTVKNVE